MTMSPRATRALGLGASLSLAMATSPAVAQKADVVHFHTSASESLAISAFAKEYDKRGGTWADDPAVGPQAEQALALNRIEAAHLKIDQD